MTTVQTITIVLLVIGGIGLGYTTMRSSKSRVAVHSGMPAELFHWISAGILAMLAPTILSSIFILHIGLLRAVLLAVIMFAVALVSMMAFAYFEQPLIEKAKRQQDDRGWTEEDARTSGL